MYNCYVSNKDQQFTPLSLKQKLLSVLSQSIKHPFHSFKHKQKKQLNNRDNKIETSEQKLYQQYIVISIKEKLEDNPHFKIFFSN